MDCRVEPGNDGVSRRLSLYGLLCGRDETRAAFMEPSCALNPLDLELLQRASHLSDEPGGTKKLN
jgi:hypothetical protein